MMIISCLGHTNSGATIGSNRAAMLGSSVSADTQFIIAVSSRACMIKIHIPPSAHRVDCSAQIFLQEQVQLIFVTLGIYS